jgi:hypothetical protein
MSITVSERSWLIAYCTKHTVAHCPHCNVGYRYLELASDLIVDWRFQFCPGCRDDLTPSLRDHLKNCVPVQSAPALLCDLCREVILGSKPRTIVDGGRSRHLSCRVTHERVAVKRTA